MTDAQIALRVAGLALMVVVLTWAYVRAWRAPVADSTVAHCRARGRERSRPGVDVCLAEQPGVASFCGSSLCGVRFASLLAGSLIVMPCTQRPQICIVIGVPVDVIDLVSEVATMIPCVLANPHASVPVAVENPQTD